MISCLRKVKKIILFFVMIYVLLGISTYADFINQKMTFFTNDEFDQLDRSQLDATLLLISEYAYFYTEDAYWNNLSFLEKNKLRSNLETLSREFDTNIYEKETKFWGSEANPGIDNDLRMTILLEDLKGTFGGYFETMNGYSKERSPRSNEREMMALNIEAVLYNMDLAKNFLAHEIQHIISFNQKELKNNIYEDIWLNELRSEYATTVAGYNDDYNTSNLIKRVGTFLDNQSDSLTEWPNVPKDYAQVALFGEYLVEQYGADILTETLRSNLFGINSINQFLSDRGHQERFKDIFIDWMIALYINDSGFDSRYGYIRDGLKSLKMNKSENFRRVFPTITSYFDFVSIKDWQPIWLEYDVQPLSSDMRKSIRLDIDGPRGKESIASYIVFYDDRAPEVFNIPILNNSGTAYILNSSGTMNKILVVATSTNKIMDFSSIEPPRSLSVRLSIIDSEIVKANTLKDGSLIKRTDGDEIYVIRGNYKRYLTPETINLYGHISSDDAISVPLSIFNSYKTSNYVKYIDDEKVYAIWPDGTKHWFNMTEDQFLGSNRKVDAIYIINELELNSYKSGVDIIK